ncbi:interleukin-34-like [Rhinoderma darwinii]|uniref:interleukin-34-like n=1 Tax=Rhinoderma darwinii TaxID=43563 RepID=UPI003F681278
MSALRGVVFFLCVLGRTAVILDECRIIELISRKLMIENRVMYLRDFFPIDYQLPVKYEEILRCQNVTSLINEGITVKELRFLWGIVNDNVLLSIRSALPQKHPSRSYINDLKEIFKLLHLDAQPELSDVIQDVLQRLWTPGNKVKGVAPKFLLDDCVRVLDVLYREECDRCLPSAAPEDVLCPNGTAPGEAAL